VIWQRAERAGGDVDRLRQVVTRRKQFSAYPACTRLTPWTAPVGSADRWAWAVSVKIAHEMTDGRFRPTVQADHYHAVTVSPRWAKQLTLVATVGKHKFYC
jgi:spore germination cell wall hydrolase CwlJ-like protein